MTNIKTKKKNKFAVVAGITGAVVGTGAAVATAVVLKDKKNRDKVKKVFTNAKNQAVGYLEKVKKEMKKEVKKDADLISKKAATTKRKVKKIIQNAKKEEK